MARWFDSMFGDVRNTTTWNTRTLYPSKPFWQVLLTKDEDLIRQHIMDCYKANYQTHFERIQRMRLNLALYTGVQNFNSEIQLVAKEGVAPSYVGSTPKITSTHIQRLVNEQVTAALVNPTDVAVVPFGTDFKNGIQADTVKELLDCIDQDINKSRNRETLHRQCRIFGESYRRIFWNPDKGPLDPTYLSRKKAGKKIQIEDSEGNLVDWRRAIYQGDVDEFIPYPWDVGFAPASRMSAAAWGFERYMQPTEEVRADYPNLREEILPTLDASQFDPDIMNTQMMSDHTLVIEFYARSSPYLPEGAYYKITPDCILESGPNPCPDVLGSQMGNLPWERLVDLDVDGQQHGMSRIQNVAQLANQFDNTLTLRGRNIYIAAHPKWIIPKGSVNINRLANKVTVVQYAGSVPPRLETNQSVPTDVMQYQQDLRTLMDDTYGSNAALRGEPPQGVTATSALQFLDSQAQQALTLWTIKNDQFEIDTYTKRLAIISLKYEKNDKRITRALGEDQKWQAKIFDVATLNEQYELRLNISTELPKRKDALMQTVFQMSQIWPTLFPPEAVARMFKLGHAEKFMSAAYASWQAAEAENYRASKGEKLGSPFPGEDLIVHWKCHYKQMQMPDYRFWSDEDRTEHETHMLETEYMMLAKSKVNFIFAAEIQKLQVWPLLLPLPPDMGAGVGAGPTPGLPAPDQQGAGQDNGTVETSMASSVPRASINQSRSRNGQFGQAVQPIM